MLSEKWRGQKQDVWAHIKVCCCAKQEYNVFGINHNVFALLVQKGSHIHLIL